MNYKLILAMGVLVTTSAMADDVTNALDKANQGVSATANGVDSSIHKAEVNEQSQAARLKQKRADAKARSDAQRKARQAKLDAAKAKATDETDRVKQSAQNGMDKTSAAAHQAGQDINKDYDAIKNSVTNPQ